MPEITIWQAERGRVRTWCAGVSPDCVAGSFVSPIAAFSFVREDALRNGYSREVVLRSRTGREVRTRV